MTPRLIWSRASGHDELRVEGLPRHDLGRLRALPVDALARELPVFASELLDDANGDRIAPVLAHHLRPMNGEYRCDDTGITFTPRHSLFRGRSYSAVVGDRELSVQLPVASGPRTRVVAIHPSHTLVPRNLLRCYVEFSAPMSEGEAGREITVLDAAGDPRPGALLDMEPELWDPQRTRLTVLFDPARIKRGLAPHREAGYPLHEGEPVALVVGPGMRDARGTPLGVAARRRYSVAPDVRALVEPGAWRLDPVAAGTRVAFRVTFGRALDHALLAHCLTIVDGQGRVVPGVGAPIESDTAWRFVPDRPWTAGRHLLVVDPMLEDVCGNSVTRVFDRDLSDAAHAPGPEHPVAVPFTPC